MKKPERKDKDPYESVNRRLDALIRITAETLFISNDRKIGEADSNVEFCWLNSHRDCENYGEKRPTFREWGTIWVKERRVKN